MKLLRSLSFLKTRISNRNDEQEPRYQVIFYTTMIIAGIVLSFSFLLVGEQEVQNKAQRESLHSLNDDGAALRGRIAELTQVGPTARADDEVPHPILADRDAQLIGSHVDVSWTPVKQSHIASTEYELNLLPVNIDPEPASKPIPPDKGPLIPFFLASDSSHFSSRIPSSNLALPAGTYAWRVAQVSPGYVVEGNSEPDIGMLSPWSNYGYFTLYRNIEQRIVKTGIVRVGVDTSQASGFTRAERGSVAGTDVDEVRHLVEDCLTRDQKTGLKVNLSSCKERGHSSSCGLSGGANHNDEKTAKLCIQFVPVAKWGQWQVALRRKEIDLFIGGLTKAVARQGNGVRFLDAYLSYNTGLYVNKADIPNQRVTMSTWIRRHRIVGVIADSSNEVLLEELIKVHCPEGKQEENARQCVLGKKRYPSFPALDRALDMGEVDGVLIDAPFVTSNEWSNLAVIRTTEPRAWKAYEHDFLGYTGKEKLSFAVAVDEPNPGECSLWSVLNVALGQKSLPTQRGDEHCVLKPQRGQP